MEGEKNISNWRLAGDLIYVGALATTLTVRLVAELALIKLRGNSSLGIISRPNGNAETKKTYEPDQGDWFRGRRLPEEMQRRKLIK